MADLVGFLRARFDEEEEAARAAGGGAWRYELLADGPSGKSGESGGYALQLGDERVIVDVGFMEDDVMLPAEAEHSARHDPARVLRDIEAKRRTLARHALSPAEGDPERPWDDQDDCQYDGDLWPCPDVRDLAAPYAGHPDYQDEWRPA